MSLPDPPHAAPTKKSHPVPAAEANGQLIVSLAIVIGLVLLGAGLIVAGCVTKDHGLAWGGVGTIIGALATALNAPSGVTSTVRAAMIGKTPPA